MTDDPAPRRADPSPLERAVDEGFLIVRASLVVSAANQVIRRALQEHLPFDEEAATRAVREEAARLVDEQLEGMRRLRTVRRRTHRSYGQSQHQFDYRVEDVDALRMRETTHKQLARLLGRAARDDAFVAEVVAAARARAWDDVGSTVVDRIGWAAAAAPGYDEGRDERIGGLVADLGRLGDDRASVGDAPADPDGRTREAPDADGVEGPAAAG